MKFPREFSDLLSPRAKVTGLPPGQRFAALNGALDRKKAAACLALLEKNLLPALTPFASPIPPGAIAGMRKNYQELLPKTVCAKTVYLERRKSRAFAVAEKIGLVAMLQSKSFHALAEKIAARRLAKKWGMQVLAYEAGDYAGPHNDHHPEEPRAIDGYFDLHITLCTSAVAQQFLVYAKGGHFSEIASVNTLGGVTAYRLPFWHYTTPLVAKLGRRKEARRWVLLGTFLYV